jgi:hypothetical protein
MVEIIQPILSDETTINCVKNARSSAYQMLSIVYDFIDYSDIKAKKFKPFFDMIKIKQLFSFIESIFEGSIR